MVTNINMINQDAKCAAVNKLLHIEDGITISSKNTRIEYDYPEFAFDIKQINNCSSDQTDINWLNDLLIIRKSLVLKNFLQVKPLPPKSISS